MKWLRCVFWPAGALLVLVGACSILRVAYRWSPSCRQASRAAARSHVASFDPATGDPAIKEAAQLRVYGPIASAVGNDGRAHEALDSADQAADAENGSARLQGITSGLDREASPPDAPLHFLHRRLSVKELRTVEFVVPAHAVRPHLRGTFQALASGGEKLEVLLVRDDQCKDFLHGVEAELRFTTGPSQGGEVNWLLDSPVGGPQKYVLVFRNSSQALRPVVLDADFTLAVQ